MEPSALEPRQLIRCPVQCSVGVLVRSIIILFVAEARVSSLIEPSRMIDIGAFQSLTLFDQSFTHMIVDFFDEWDAILFVKF